MGRPIIFFWSWATQETVHEANSSISLFKISLPVLHSHKTWPDLSPLFLFYKENLFFPAQFANILNPYSSFIDDLCSSVLQPQI